VSAPIRLQFRRTGGFRLQEISLAANGRPAVYVGWPSKWGNLWTVRALLGANPGYTEADTVRICVEAYRAWLQRRPHWAHAIPLAPPPDLTPLGGKNLACWCTLEAPCHADVLLELANR